MAMQGKTSGDKPALDFDKAEQAADAFRPSWDVDDVAPATDPMATTMIVGSANAPITAPVPPVIVGTPVIGLGNGNVNETAPFRRAPAPAPEPQKAIASTQLGLSPAQVAVVAAANAANATVANGSAGAAPPTTMATKLGGISPAAAAVVAAANAAARAPQPSSEAIDSDAMIEVIPKPPMTTRMPDAPTSSAPATFSSGVASSNPPLALPASPSNPPATATAAARAAAVTQAPAQKTPSAAPAPLPIAAPDPFRSASISSSDDDLFPQKKSNKVVFIGLGCAALLVVGLVVKFAGSSDEAPAKPAASVTAVGPAIPSPTNDIPPPPPKEEEPAPAPKTAAAPPAPEPTPAAAPAPTPRAKEPVAAAPKPADPPRAAAPPAQPKPRAAPPPAAAPPAPKTAPKATGGGIVRDSPF
jgi:hypothetical protein